MQRFQSLAAIHWAHAGGQDWLKKNFGQVFTSGISLTFSAELLTAITVTSLLDEQAHFLAD